MFKPRYKITHKILNFLTEITAAREVIEEARLIPKWEMSLRKEALIHSAHSSTHIEGNTLSLEDVSLLAIGREVSAIRKDKQEVINYLDVLSNLEKYIPQKNITKQIILKLHKSVVNKTLNLKKDEGAFRDRQVVVGYRDSEGRTVVTFRPTKTKDVPKEIQELLDWLNNESQPINPVLVGGISHYEFVRVHPFIDGNGRTARVLATLIFLIRGFDTKRFFALDDYYDSDRISYYDALKSVNPKTLDITEWLEYFCEGVAYSVNRVKDKVVSLSSDKLKTQTLEQVALTKRQMEIINEMSKKGRIANKDLQNRFNITPQAVHKELKKLINMRVIKLVGVGRGAFYELM